MARENGTGINGFVKYAQQVTSFCKFSVWIFVQKSTSGYHECKETPFGLHKDNEDKKNYVKLSIIIHLIKTQSSMQILTKK